MSRRAAEDAIRAGIVKVNGVKAGIGQKIDPERDEVTFGGKKVEPDCAGKVYIALNKPRGYVSTMSDERGRKCVAELVSDVGARVFPMGRLDMDSEGLLLFTNDGELANKLTHPGHDIPKIYHVKLEGEITPEQLKRLGGRFNIDGYDILPVKCSVVSRKEGHTVVRMELYEGRNRQIRKMCETLSLKVENLRRVAIGEIALGNLAPGKWRRLSGKQIDYLKKVKIKPKG